MKLDPKLGEMMVEKVLARRKSVWALTILLTALSLVGVTQIGVDNAVEVWFLDDDPALASYRDFQESFGNDEMVVLGVTGGAGGVLGAEGLTDLQAVGAQAVAIDGIAKVQSSVTVAGLRIDGGMLEVGLALEDEAPDEAAATAAAQRIREDRLLSGMISEDGSMGLVLAQMEAMDNIDAKRDGVLANLRSSLEGISDNGVPMAGIGVVYSALNVASTQGSVVFIVASYVLITVLLWVIFGRIGPVALTLGVVGLGATWLMGTYGALGKDINMVTMVMPTLLLVIGVSDCVHMLTHTAAQPAELPPAERVKRGVGFVFWPCLFNTLTTGMGFLALTTASMPVVRDLGAFSALGLGLAFILSVFLCSLAATRGSFIPTIDDKGKLQRFVDSLARLAVEKPGHVLIVAAFATLLAALGITKTVVDTYSIDFLYASHQVRKDSAAIEQAYGPYTPLEFVVRAEGGVRNVEVLGAITDWQDRVESELGCPGGGTITGADGLPCVGWSQSMGDVVRRLNEVLSVDNSYAMPTAAAALEQLFFLFESDPDADLSRVMSIDEGEARVTFGVPMDSAQGFGQMIGRVEALAGMPAGVTVEASGYLPLYVAMMDHIVQSQLSSFGLAFIIIFALIGLLFKSLRMAVLAVPANLIPVLLTLGMMGLLGIRLDVATVTIAAIVLGLVVDDTVQFLYRYRHESKKTDDVAEAVYATVRGVGRPMAITTIVLGLGFSVLGLTAIKSVAFFGLLLAFALASALLCDLLVIPALLVLLDQRKTLVAQARQAK